MVQMTETNVTDDQPPGATPAVGADKPATSGAQAVLVPERITGLGETVGNVRCDDPYVVAENVDVFYGDNHAI